MNCCIKKTKEQKTQKNNFNEYLHAYKCCPKCRQPKLYEIEQTIENKQSIMHMCYYCSYMCWPNTPQ